MKSDAFKGNVFHSSKNNFGDSESILNRSGQPIFVALSFPPGKKKKCINTAGYKCMHLEKMNFYTSSAFSAF